MKTNLCSAILTIILLIPLGSVAQTAGQQIAPATVVKAERYYRTELYLGRSIPGGGMVGEAAWEVFLNDIVTPRFPHGFTVLSGRGQYREASGVIAKEPSQVLVFLYKKAERNSAGTKIEEIRREYVRRFKQESVMRIDFAKSVLVAF